MHVGKLIAELGPELRKVMPRAQQELRGRAEGRCDRRRGSGVDVLTKTSGLWTDESAVPRPGRFTKRPCSGDGFMRDSSRCGWCDLRPAARSTLIWGHVPALHVSPLNLIGAPILVEIARVMSTAEGTYSRTGADFDPTGVYRYSLWREWDARAPAVAFVMLNPSTADAGKDDPTIRRCASFARSWGYGSLEVVNLFAYRASEPKRLRQTPDPIGPANDRLPARRGGPRPDVGRRLGRTWYANG